MVNNVVDMLYYKENFSFSLSLVVFFNEFVNWISDKRFIRLQINHSLLFKNKYSYKKLTKLKIYNFNLCVYVHLLKISEKCKYTRGYSIITFNFALSGLAINKKGICNIIDLVVPEVKPDRENDWQTDKYL